MGHDQKAASNYDACPICGGTGYELFRQRVDGYDSLVEFARPCTRCRAEKRMQDMTGVPPQFRNADLGKFGFSSYSRDMGNLRKITEDFLKNYRTRWEKSGKGLYLWSKTSGSGKTFLSCCLGKSVMIKYDLRMRFVTVPDYLAAVGESYKRQQGEHDASTVYRECDLLIFDDIGAQKSGEWQEQEIFRIVNERLNAGRIIIFTANMSPEDLNLDSRTIDRIMKQSVILQMPEESIRRNEAQEAQKGFLREILQA